MEPTARSVPRVDTKEEEDKEVQKMGRYWKQKKKEAHNRFMASLDWEKEEGPDPRDPRYMGWPCNGSHEVPENPMGNAHCAWKTCTKCAIRWQYVPRKGSTGKYRQASPLPEYVNIAIAKMQTMMTAEECDYKDMEHIIEKVQREEQLKDRQAIKKEKSEKKEFVKAKPVPKKDRN